MVSGDKDIHHGLIEQCRQGQKQGFYRLYQLYAKAMFNVCLRLTGNRGDAEDLVQEAFADAFGRIAEFRYDSTFGYWLKQITVNKCISFLRKRKVELEFIEDIEALDQPEIDERISEHEEVLKVERVRKAMETLPDGSRSIFSLYLFEGYDHTEIAEIMNITESTSKSQYMRARLRVKEILLQDERE